MSLPIVFYDIPNALPLEKRSWSGNCLRTRFALNYKGLPYKTIWVEYADVQQAMREIGAPSTMQSADGTPRYTLPTIHDPNTGKTIADSVAIAQYLDAQYPGRPLMPSGTEAQQVQFASTALGNVFSVFPLIVRRAYENVPKRSQATFEAVLRSRIGGPPFAERELFGESELPNIYAAFSRLGDALAESNKQSADKLGDSINFAEMVTAAALVFVSRVLTDEQLNTLLNNEDRKLGKIWDRVQPYMTIDAGELYVPKSD